MDFFEHQDLARRKSGLLILYFLGAVTVIVIAVYAAVLLTLFGVHAKEAASETAAATGGQFDLWRPDIFLITTLGTLALITAGSLYKTWALSDGGDAVARMFGGHVVSQDTSDPDERRLRNVVEEMAIASGIPVPPVYVMDDEDGINAFAAGFTPDDAVIAVTRGCMQLLNRDELQGVIAHEFSHIINGDMRLNVRLMGILHGIVLISIVGYFIFRSVLFSGGRSRRSSSSGRGGKGGGGVIAVVVLGLLLMVIGYVGVFFGRLIKAALSRQREYLADASSVQFTRNPEGIAGALKKIGGLGAGSRIHDTHAEEASHLFFENALKPKFFQLLSTHPPLQQRLVRVDPSFDGSFPEVAPVDTGRVALKDQYPGTTAEREEAEEAEEAEQPFGALEGELEGVEGILTTAAVLGQVGTPQPEHLDYARKLRASIPKPLRDAAHEPFGARAVVYGLLLDEAPGCRRKQLARLAESADSGVYQLTTQLIEKFDALKRQQCLPLIDMALPSLKNLSEPQFRDFRGNVQYLIEADEEIDLFEYTLQRIIVRHLMSAFVKVKKPAVQYYSLRRLTGECSTLLSVLAHAGQEDEAKAVQAFEQAAGCLQLAPGVLRMLSREEATLPAADEALDNLAAVSPKHKRSLVEACSVCIAVDRKVTVNEAELLRVVADSLDCPIPPFLPGQTL